MADGSVNLPAQFEVGQDGKDLLGAFFVRNAGYVNLHGSFESQAVLEIPSRFTVQRNNQFSIPAKFVVAQLVKNLTAKFFIQNAGTANLLGEFVVQHTLDLPSEFVIRRSSSGNLSAEMVVRVAGAQNLPAAFFVRNLGVKNLSGKFIVRHSYTDSAIIIAEDPNAWFNYSENVGTGFLSRPTYAVDTKVKEKGQASLRIKDNYVSGGFDYIQFGWKYRHPVIGEDTWPGTGKTSKRLSAKFVLGVRKRFIDLKAGFYVDNMILPDGLWDYQFVWQNLAAEIEVGLQQGQIEVDPTTGAITARQRHAINDRTIVTMVGSHRAYSKGTFTFDAQVNAEGGVDPIYTPAFGLIENKWDWFAGSSAHAVMLVPDGVGGWDFYTENDGATETTAILGVNFKVQHTFKIIWENASEYPVGGRIRLYIDDVLKATHTTAVPTHPLQFFLMMYSYIVAYSTANVWTRLYSFSATGVA